MQCRVQLGHANENEESVNVQSPTLLGFRKRRRIFRYISTYFQMNPMFPSSGFVTIAALHSFGTSLVPLY